MTSFRAPRRLSVPLVLAFLIAFALVLVPSSPASAAPQGITGTVTGPGGTPLSGIDVGFFRLVPGGYWGYMGSATTGASGNYAMQLSVGVWRVGFAGGSEDYDIEYYDDVADVNDATNVWVTESQVTPHIDAQLAPSGHVTGHVEDSAGSPIAGADVRGYQFDGQHWTAGPAVAQTDASGDYDLLVASGAYRLGFSADGYVDEFFDDVATVGAGTSIVVPGGGATLSGKDAVLQEGVALSGTVTLPAAADPGDSDGDVTVVDTATGDPVAEAQLSSDEETAPGSHTYPWSVNGLPAGSYRVEFGHVNGHATSEAEFYNDHPESAGADSANPIQLQAGQQKTGVDATLRAGGTISGKVVDGNGAPLAGCKVLAVNSVDHFVTRGSTTAADGTFIVGGLTTGAYGVIVGLAAPSGPCNSSEYYTNKNGDLSETPAAILPVTTAPGTNTALGATLVYKGSVPVPDITNSTAPSLPSGAPVVGTAVTANPGTWDPADVTLSYQWRVNGGVIPGATSQSYTPPAEATGLKLSVTVTASKAGYTSKSVSSNETAPVVGVSTSPTVVQNFTLPSVGGVQRVGSQVTANPGTWTPGAVTSVQWLRNGEPVPGATGSTYTLGAADAGTYIQVFVTAAKDGLTSTSRLSPSTDPVLPGILTATSAPRMVGKLKVGKFLHAVPPSCSPVATGVRYRWMRNGIPIKGSAAKQAQYKLVRADRGKHISVRITLTRPGYDDNVTVGERARKVR